jgi:hypothetical protein
MQFKRLRCLYLDILAIPGIFMSKKGNADWHMKYICPKCPAWRKKMRHVTKNDCYWLYEWKNKNYHIPKSYGAKNWLFQMFLLKTDLTRFKKFKY